MLVLGVTNARSVCNKPLEVCDLVREHALDVACITETWLHGDMRDNPILVDMTPEHYTTEHVARGTRGGGVGVIMREQLPSKKTAHPDLQSFECLDLTLSTQPPLRLITVYRPPTSTSFVSFLDEMDELLADVILCGGRLAVTGDFNVHVDTAAANPTPSPFNN